MPRTLTSLLRAWSAGDVEAGDALMPLVYDELHVLAAASLRDERPGHTFRPTDLVSEAYLRMVGGAQPEWNDRVHFYAFASRVMRRILVDHARKRLADKRGAGAKALTLDDDGIAAQLARERPDELVALDDALVELADFDKRKARVIELHYFGGLTQAEIAHELAVHVNTAARDLKLAEAWLHRALGHRD
jgi:RNA polymerase sigma factor (TIGR02999 family)